MPDDATPESGSEVGYDLRTAIAALPAQQRAIVVLRYLFDLTEADAAATMGGSVGAVKQHHSRALAALRRHPALNSDEV